MVTMPTLALLDFNIPFVIETDASGFGLGAVLTQNQRPLAYFSQHLSPNAHLKAVYERELMVIVLVVQKWRHYLLGHKFTACTDQRALKHLSEMANKIIGMDFEIRYYPRLLNKAADALSRIPEHAKLNTITVPTLVDTTLIQAEVQADSKHKPILAQLDQDPDSVPKYAMEQNQLFYENQLVLSATSVLIPAILHTFHDSVIGEHSGFLCTYKRLTCELY